MSEFRCGLMGMPPVLQKLLVGRQGVPTIAAICCDQGLLDCQTVLETVSGCQFRKLNDSLASYLQVFNGTNPHSNVVLDNACIHHANGIVDKVQRTGALVYFLPPCYLQSN